MRRPFGPVPHWLWVSVVVGGAVGVSSVVLGWLVALVGNWIGACTGDLSCAAAFALGLYGAPVSAVGGALVGGITAFRAARKGTYEGSAIWKRCLGFGVLALLLAATGLAVLATILR